jgi:hypothetical protein
MQITVTSVVGEKYWKKVKHKYNYKKIARYYKLQRTKNGQIITYFIPYNPQIFFSSENGEAETLKSFLDSYFEKFFDFLR